MRLPPARQGSRYLPRLCLFPRRRRCGRRRLESGSQRRSGDESLRRSPGLSPPGYSGRSLLLCCRARRRLLPALSRVLLVCRLKGGGEGRICSLTARAGLRHQDRPALSRCRGRRLVPCRLASDLASRYRSGSLLQLPRNRDSLRPGVGASLHCAYRCEVPPCRQGCANRGKLSCIQDRLRPLRFGRQAVALKIVVVRLPLRFPGSGLCRLGSVS